MTDTAIVQPTDSPDDQAVDAPASEDGPVFVTLDPREVAAHPLNIREHVDVSDLLPSVQELGILQPPLVAPTDDGGWKIIAGHRRMAAAVEVGIVSVVCLVRTDLAADVEAVVGMLVENLDRADLTPMEEARGYQQLLDLGVAKTKIAKRTGRKRTHVNKALSVASSPAATEAVEAGLTLEQALVIIEFSDDPEAVEALYDSAQAGDGAFRHRASRLRTEREEAAARAAAEAALIEAGVQVIDANDRDAWPEATSLRSLAVDADSETPIDPEAHAQCPGHAAALDPWRTDTVIYYCLNPGEYGHHQRFRRPFDGRRTGPMTDAEKAERQLVIANNRAWKAAEPVRREWVRDLLNRKKTPKGLLRWTITEVTREPSHVGDATDGLLAELLGVDAPQGTYGRTVGADRAAKATDATLPLVLFAQVAADREHNMDASTAPGKATWRNARPVAARYLLQLAEMGYALSEVERLAVEQVYPPQGTDADPDPDPDSDVEPATEPDPTAEDEAGIAPVVDLPVHNGTGSHDTPVQPDVERHATGDGDGGTA